MSELDMTEEVKENKGFLVTLEKYQAVVLVKSVNVDDDDDCLLNIEYDHDIEAPEEEISKYLGETILKMIEEGLDYPVEDAVVEKA